MGANGSACCSDGIVGRVELVIEGPNGQFRLRYQARSTAAGRKWFAEVSFGLGSVVSG